MPFGLPLFSCSNIRSVKPELRTSVTSSVNDLVPLFILTAVGKTYFSSLQNYFNFEVGFLEVVIKIFGSVKLVYSSSTSVIFVISSYSASRFYSSALNLCSYYNA